MTPMPPMPPGAQPPMPGAGPGGPQGGPPMSPMGGAPPMPGAGGMPGQQTPAGGDVKTKMQGMVMERVQQLPPEQKEALAAATPEFISAVKTVMPELGFVFDAIMVGVTAGDQKKGEQDQGNPPADYGQSPPPQGPSMSLPRPLTRLGGM